MFKIPAVPSGSKRAEGLVINSTRSTALAGKDSRKASLAPPDRPEGRPSIKICTPEDPRRVMLPSMSTWTEGMFSSNSVVLPPRLVKSLPTWNTRLSTRISMTEACSTTKASFKAVISGSSWRVPTSHFSDSGFLGVHMRGPTRWVWYPGKRTSNKRRPTSTFSMRKAPSSELKTPSKTELSLALTTTTEAKGSASCVSASCTTPNKVTSLGLGPPSAPGPPLREDGGPVWPQDVATRVRKNKRVDAWKS